MFRLIASVCAVSSVFGGCMRAAQKHPFQDTALPIEQRIDNVISLLTLDEKLASFGNAGVVVPRLGIPGTAIGEALSGVVLGGPIDGIGDALPLAMRTPKVAPTRTTQFPQGAGLGRTWDAALLEKVGAAIGSEARYIFENHQSPKAFLVLLTPNADLARDPRWGRTQECYGEDPYLNGTLAAALVKGLQGPDRDHWQAASLVKHFLANSNEDGRSGSSSDFDERLLREYYSVPFRMAFTIGGARNYMASYNAWNRVPMTVNPILKDLTMRVWGVDGIISSDAGSLGNLVTRHKAYPNLHQAAAAAVKAGINMFLTTIEDQQAALRGAVADHLLTEADLDASLRGGLRTAIRLGLLDPPDRDRFAGLKGAPNPVTSPEHRAIAKQAARESIVLLKNSSGLLPLNSKELHSIAVIGALADQVLPDLYGGLPPYAVTPLAGIRAKAGAKVRVTYTPGDREAADAARNADVAVLVVGNHPTCNRNPGQILQSLIAGASCPVPGEGMESSDRHSLTLEQEGLVKAVYAANPRTIVVLVSSFPYAINWTQEHVPAILHMSHNSQEEGAALADVLFGDYNPAGRLVQTWVKSLDQLPPMMDYNIRHGRTYLYFEGEPLYPFGFGLSFTTFAYSNLRATPISGSPDIQVSVDLKNTGTRTGDEVAQLYVTHRESKVARPLKELKAFARVSLEPGETKVVQLMLNTDSLAYWDASTSQFVLEREPLLLTVGGSSADARLTATVQIGKR